MVAELEEREIVVKAVKGQKVVSEPA